MPELKYGLNLTKKPGLPRLADRSPAKKTIFDEDDEDDEDVKEGDSAQSARQSARTGGGSGRGPVAISTLGGIYDDDGDDDDHAARHSQPSPGARPSASQPVAAPPSGPPKRKAHLISQFDDLASRHTARKHAAEAQALDPSVYEYDGVYDSLHAKRFGGATSSSSSAAAGAGGGTAPKYMTSLLAAAEVRRRDQLRAKDKALAREREEEGDAFAGRDRFVTSAYRRQQDEMARLEEEEHAREEAEAARRARMGGGAMTALYKDLLGREDERHEAAMRATDSALRDRKPDSQASTEENDGGGGGDDAKNEIRLAREKGALVNEDGQVVDKRQLLTAGLNVARKKGPSTKPSDESSGGDGRQRHRGDPTGPQLPRSADDPTGASARQAMRERQSRMLEQQLQEAAAKTQRDHDAERDALERSAKQRRATGADVSSARDRYLARKREAAAAAAATAKTAAE